MDMTEITLDEQSERAESLPMMAGTHVGRYVVLGLVGKGGMGSVYKAYDPELDRQVALKLVSAGAGSGPPVQSPSEAVTANHSTSRSRLLREAQALAQLAHPNIVAVYDVGTFGNDVFIAMEYVAGKTLREWWSGSEGKKPSRAQILQTMIAAGRGLAAAHAVGIIHRDFKPENVIIGNDGRPRVLDFGLARSTDESDTLDLSELGASFDADATPRDGVEAFVHAEPTAGHASPQSESDATQDSGERDALTHRSRQSSLLDTPLTKIGALLGTPAYMAPEQLLRGPTDARTDQFAFCIVLYEALYGQRPFASKHAINRLRHDVCHGKIRPPPKGSHVPRWLRRLLLCGLRPNPNDRFPSLAVLLDQLSQDPTAGRRRVLTSAAVLGSLALAAFGIWYGSQSGERRCNSAAEVVLDSGHSVWDDTVKNEVRTAFLSTARPHAAESFARVQQAIDDYTARWAAMATATCRATYVQHQQSEALFDRRMACLQERAAELRALVRLLRETKSGDVVDKSVAAAKNLGAISHCADIEALTTAVPLPADPAARASATELMAVVQRAQAEQLLGQYAAAQETLAKVADAVTALDHAPLLARFLYVKGINATAATRFDEAEKTLLDASAAAARARDDVLAGTIWFELCVAAAHDSKLDRAVVYNKAAQNTLERIGGDPAQRTRVMDQLGMLYRTQGDLQKSLQVEQDNLARTIKELGPDAEVLVTTYESLAVLANRLGRLTEAAEWTRKAAAIVLRTYGAQHPEMALIRFNFAQIALHLGDYAAAFGEVQQALEIRRASLGDHPLIANYYEQSGEALFGLARYNDALAEFQKALPLRDKFLPPTHYHRAYLNYHVARAELALGELDAALAGAQRAREIIYRERPNDPRRGTYDVLLGDVRLRRGELDLAEAAYKAAKSVSESSTPEGRETLAQALCRTGELALTRARFAEALAACTEAKELLLPTLGETHPFVGDAWFCVGRAALANGALDTAATALEKSREIRSAKLGEKNLQTAFVALALAQVAHARGDTVGAAAQASTALDLIDRERQDPRMLADAQFTTAQLLWDVAPDSPRREAAVLLAAKAAEQLTAHPYLDHGAKVRAWLASHRP